MWNDLPEEMWEHVCGMMESKDVRSVGACCRRARSASVRTTGKQGITVRGDTRVLGATWARYITKLTVHGAWVFEDYGTVRYRRLAESMADLKSAVAAGSLANLESLTIDHADRGFPDLPADMWDAVFASCPKLRAVTVNLSDPVLHLDYRPFLDRLVELGAPRLQELDVRHCTFQYWSGISVRPPVESSTLHTYRVTWCNSVTPVNCPALRAVSVIDDGGEERGRRRMAVLPHIMTPMARDTVETLEWGLVDHHTYSDNLIMHTYAVASFAALAECRRLRRVSLHFKTIRDAATATGLLDRLRHLPATVRHFHVDLDTRSMDGHVCHIEWPASALAHLRLESLTVKAHFPPTTTSALLGTWMGTVPATPPGSSATFRCEFVHTVHEAYERDLDEMISELGTDDSDNEGIDELKSDWRRASAPVDPRPMLEFLDAHPGLVVQAHNVYVPTRHPRFVMTPFRVPVMRP